VLSSDTTAHQEGAVLAEFIDLFDLPELEIGHSKKVLFTSDHFSIPAFTAITGTDKLFSGAFNRCMKFTLVMTVKSGHLAASGSLFL
jgi:hypothetical protein